MQKMSAGRDWDNTKIHLTLSQTWQQTELKGWINIASSRYSHHIAVCSTAVREMPFLCRCREQAPLHTCVQEALHLEAVCVGLIR